MTLASSELNKGSIEMNKLKYIISSIISALAFLFYLLFKREQSKREDTEKALEASKIAHSAAQKTLKAIEVKKDVESINKRDSRDIDDRLHDKGYLRNDS